jgi:hypothetical protein
MFEITAEDIALLHDECLRSLVGRLCESEMRRRGISASCVTWGGNQNAKDGGVDVRVEFPPNVAADGPIPRPDTVFQMKAEDITPTEIEAEMRPDGTLRPVIKDLAQKSGAYIIVSSKSSTTDLARQNRLEAMAKAVRDLPNRDALKLDFYDRKRLETWLRDHLGTTLWVRERIGKSIHGWRSHGDWSQVPEGADTDYLLDNELRITTDRQRTEPALTAVAGINLIRDRLREPRGVVRLVGLSGAGKTRFAEALFDPAVGENTLDTDLAAYTDVAKNPNPEPNAMAAEMIATQKPAILVIDNCRPELHRQLAESCRSAGSRLSLITIEYDVQDDLPEGTDVFTLGNASIDLTEKLTRQRFPRLSSIDSRRVAEYSGGNARIALAIASTIEKNDSTATLSDADLLRRLFQQKRGSDPMLLSAAEALSLVYSFDAEDVSATAELARIGGMIGKTAQEMFASSAELKRRDLVQVRSKWRAVLPQGIANNLAAQALENIPQSIIESHLVSGGSERLLKSFSKRLSFLHANEQAQKVVTGWLGPDGLLKEFPRFNALGRAVFENIAPVVPEATLSAIERVLLKTPDPEIVAACKTYLRLLRSLAYEAPLFERCMTLIVKILESDGSGSERDEGTRLVASIFPIHASGTHASIQQRLDIADSLLLSGIAKERALGLVALTSLLEATHFGPGWDSYFGARRRDYGYAPKSRDEVNNWFTLALKLAERHACSDEPVAEEVCNVLASQFRGLWSRAQMYDDLDRIFRMISKKAFWREGWLSVRQTIRFDAKDFSEELAARLSALEVALRPQKLVDQVRAIVLSESVTFAGMDSEDDKNLDDVTHTMLRVANRAEELGRAVTADEAALVELLPELLTGKGQLWNFGRGMAQSATDPAALWHSVVSQLDAIPPTRRHPEILGGFLHFVSQKNSALANSLLDDSVENESLAPSYPWFQAQAGIDGKGIQRLTRSLETGKTATSSYANLIAGRATKQVPGKELRAFLLALAAKDAALDTAIEILSMRVLSDGPGTPRDPELVDAGQILMAKLRFENTTGPEDYRLQILGRYCLNGEGAAPAVRNICNQLGGSIARYQTHALYHDGFLDTLFAAQPLAALQGFCSGVEGAGVNVARGINDLAQLRINPVARIPMEELISWCDEDPTNRYRAIAGVVIIFGTSPATGELGWSDVAIRLLDKAPDKVEVLKRFIERFSPWAWSGSRSAIVASNARLLDQLNTSGDPTLVAFIAAAKVRLTQSIEAERDLESYIWGTDQSFE